MTMNICVYIEIALHLIARKVSLFLTNILFESRRSIFPSLPSRGLAERGDPRASPTMTYPESEPATALCSHLFPSAR